MDEKKLADLREIIGTEIFSESKEEARKISEIDGVESLDLTCDICPFQLEGTIDGVPFYFRERHDHWSMSIGEDTIGISIGRSKGFYCEGDYSGDHVVDFTEAITKFRSTKGIN